MGYTKKSYEVIIKELKSEIKNQKALMKKYDKEMAEAKTRGDNIAEFSAIYSKYKKAKQQVVFKSRTLKEKERRLAQRKANEKKRATYAAKHKK